MTNICILTPHPDYEENWQPYANQYRALFGDHLSFRAWTDAGDLTSFDLVLPLLAWGYQRRPDEWFRVLDTWETQGVRMANAIPRLKWNTDKAYLSQLAKAGVAVVPTVAAPALCEDNLALARKSFNCEALVVKPAISGGADGTYVLLPGAPVPVDVLNRDMLIQPMMETITTEGEYSLFYFGGTFSHAILKTPAAGDFRVQEQFGGREIPVTPPDAARDLAITTLNATPVPPLYARVDMVRDGAGHFRLMELEAIEPSLFLQFADDQGQAFADAVRRALVT